MAYADLNTIHNPATGTVAPASWGDQARDNLEFLIDPPVCSISDTAVTATSGATTVLGATATENFDNNAMHSNVTNPSRITIQTTGRYLVLGNMVTDSFTGTLNAFVRFSFRVDGTTSIGGTQIKNSTAAEVVRLTAARAISLTSGQYIEATTHQTLGGSIQVTLDELMVMFLTR